MNGRQSYNILVTLDEGYVPYLNVMLSSLLYANPDGYFTVYMIHSSVSEEAVAGTREILGKNGELVLRKVDDMGLDGAPTTSRYPREMYYRIFASAYLPDSLDRILYLDPDIIVNGSISELYNMPMENCYFAAASHIRKLMHKLNTIRLDMDDESPYINSGVMMMNLDLLRREQTFETVLEFIEKRKPFLLLPDQDIISSLYGAKICELDPFRYNMTEVLYLQYSPFDRELTLDWVRENSVIIHYCGRNKPWKSSYFGKLDVFYNETIERMEEIGFSVPDAK